MTWPETVEDQPLAVRLATSTASTCSIEVLYVTGTSVDVKYTGLPGNQPGSYWDYVAIWPGPVVPWTRDPMKQVTIETDLDPGTVGLDGLAITKNAYTVVFAVGPKRSDICASAIVSAGGLATIPTSVGISVNNIGTTSLSLHYRTLSGYLPASSRNWIGLWAGLVSPYNLPDKAVGKVNIPENINESDVDINGIVIKIGTTYTVIYFMGKEPTTAAALLTFTTDD